MRIPILTILLILPAFLFSQTTISGVINDYYRVVEVIPSKSCVRVDNTVNLTRNDIVMLIQMKGAAVVTTNTATFGSITSLNNAGNYEVASVCGVKDDSVFFYKQIAQTYTVADKVQLVRIPQYNSAIVTGLLQSMPWDSASGKGGVLALNVYDDLFLNAPVSADGAGYKGGAYVISSGTCANFGAPAGYFYNATSINPQNGAYKGESISTLAVAMSGGKGGNANGGGGGNNHNNGGGGGSNLSAGGNGGGNSSAIGCSASNPAKGAWGLTNSSGAKIYMGGGGGAGHSNGGSSTGGGNGGGIIFIHANNIYSNGFRITSTGAAGGSEIGNGASGGGGGGTIILDVNNYADNVNVQAEGGVGGNENDDLISQRCYGEGGGGGGGAIFFKTATPAGTISVAGGLKGSRINTLNCAAFVFATDGAAGSSFSSYTYMQSSTISGSCAPFALPVVLIYFKATASNDATRLDWEATDKNDQSRFVLERKTEGGQWTSIHEVVASGTGSGYTWLDKSLSDGFYQYRLKIVEPNGVVKYSLIQGVRINNKKQILLFPNPASTALTVAYPFKQNTRLQIFDAIGRLVFQKKIVSETNFYKQDISFLKKGIYRVVADQQSSMLLVQ